ncbi:MAG: ABC transporter ATP-binding protein [Alphaproteobacteria bacterium]|nr:ABC transporter ATP-binding protein [Alphaproteobacteria bacterium]
MSEVPALRLEGVRRVFEQGGTRLEVLKGVDLALAPGELVALVGPSGAGKSTLLHVAGLLESPTAGGVFVQGRDCGRMGDDERTRIRRDSIGFVYQYHHLLPEFSALENVMLPRIIAGKSRAEARDTARALLADLGLSARESHRPARLSGGEQQRVAIARALANGPAVLLADEPTGNLDSRTADTVFAELVDFARRRKLAALIATHNDQLARRMDRVLHLADGVVS